LIGGVSWAGIRLVKYEVELSIDVNKKAKILSLCRVSFRLGISLTPKLKAFLNREVNSYW
ncbi:MAG: hypothetical protein J7J05_00335, partial [Thermococcus sp.]|uniref:hypothetical protein n=1 Tax=Thermococcus sp. TaxID=35749 RepID=UPI002622A90A